MCDSTDLSFLSSTISISIPYGYIAPGLAGFVHPDIGELPPPPKTYSKDLKFCRPTYLWALTYTLPGAAVVADFGDHQRHWWVKC